MKLIQRYKRILTPKDTPRKTFRQELNEGAASDKSHTWKGLSLETTYIEQVLKSGSILKEKIVFKKCHPIETNAWKNFCLTLVLDDNSKQKLTCKISAYRPSSLGLRYNFTPLVYLKRPVSQEF